jgi:D-alanine-D-alanine ligase
VKEEDFEKMIPIQWWKDLFDDLYLKTDGDVVEDPEITKEEIRFVDVSNKRSCNGC